MLSNDAACFIKSFVEELNESLKSLNFQATLSYAQKTWLSFCLTGILLTNGICWAKFQRCFLGRYTDKALSCMFRQGKIVWNLLLIASVKQILLSYGITEGQLVLDEIDRGRCKSTMKKQKTLESETSGAG